MKGVFTTRVIPDDDDLPERQYELARTQLRQKPRNFEGSFRNGQPSPIFADQLIKRQFLFSNFDSCCWNSLNFSPDP